MHIIPHSYISICITYKHICVQPAIMAFLIATKSPLLDVKSFSTFFNRILLDHISNKLSYYITPY